MFKNIDKVVFKLLFAFFEIYSFHDLWMEIPFYWKLLVIGKKRKKISKEKIIIRQAESLVPVPKDAPQGRKKLTP